MLHCTADITSSYHSACMLFDSQDQLTKHKTLHLGCYEFRVVNQHYNVDYSCPNAITGVLSIYKEQVNLHYY